MYITINLINEYTISSNEKRRIVVPDGTIMRHSEMEEIGVDGHGNDGGYDGGVGE